MEPIRGTLSRNLLAEPFRGTLSPNTSAENIRQTFRQTLSPKLELPELFRWPLGSQGDTGTPENVIFDQTHDSGVTD